MLNAFQLVFAIPPSFCVAWHVYSVMIMIRGVKCIVISCYKIYFTLPPPSDSRVALSLWLNKVLSGRREQLASITKSAFWHCLSLSVVLLFGRAVYERV